MTTYFHCLQGDVFYRPEGSNGELVVIDREVLKVSEVYQCSAPGWCRGLPFSDGINIGHISPDREVSFCVEYYHLAVTFFHAIVIVIQLLNSCLWVLCFACYGCLYLEEKAKRKVMVVT